tara:strand:- start:11 stop:184 length:174 start_codon:yes stop_codon:yes gene_type:complete
MTIKNIMVNQYPEPKDLTSAFDIVKAIVYEYDGHDDDTREAWKIVVTHLNKNNTLTA